MPKILSRKFRGEEEQARSETPQGHQNRRGLERSVSPWTSLRKRRRSLRQSRSESTRAASRYGQSWTKNRRRVYHRLFINAKQSKGLEAHQRVGNEAAGFGPVWRARSVPMPVQVPVAGVVLHAENRVVSAGHVSLSQDRARQIKGQ